MTDFIEHRTVLVVGASGVFGSRLVAGLLRTTSFFVVMAGRNQDRLTETARHMAAQTASAAARLTTVRLDAASAGARELRATGAFAVVDAAGPYQGGDYRLARAAIAAGLHYVDLADARNFVRGFGALDVEAKAAGVVALTGASSTPALSNAALDRLTAGWTRVDTVQVAISPGNRAPRGLAVVRSILSYAGKPVRVFAGGRWRERPGWGMTVRRDMPGIGRRWFALAETPDLDIVPARFAVRDAAIFQAGLELPLLHLGLLVASLPVRAGVLRSLAPLARPARFLAMLLDRLGSDRGGMTVVAVGLDALGEPASGSWSLVAEAGDGPFVPTLPAIATLRALASGAIIRPGASACVGVLALEQIEREFAGLRIATDLRFERPPACLYARVLGEKFRELPQPIREMHCFVGTMRARGVSAVDGADTLAARAAATVFGFPTAATEVPLTVEMEASGGRERWVRDFGGRRFATILYASGRPGRVVERFGPLAFELDLRVGSEGVLGMPVAAWRLGPVRLPPIMAPVSLAREWVDDAGRFCFDVELRLPLGLGRLVRYRGWLARESATADILRAPAGG